MVFGEWTMADPKKHHFSPVFYLKGWCNTNSKIIEYSRPHRRVVAKAVSPEYTGFKRLLYTLEGVPRNKNKTLRRMALLNFEWVNFARRGGQFGPGQGLSQRQGAAH